MSDNPEPEAEMSINPRSLPRSFRSIAPGDRDDIVMTPEEYAAIQAVISEGPPDPKPAVERFTVFARLRPGGMSWSEVVLAPEHDAALEKQGAMYDDARQQWMRDLTALRARAEAAEAALADNERADVRNLGYHQEVCKANDALRARIAELEGELAAAKGEMACRYSPFDPGEERDYDKCEHCGDYHIVKRRAEPGREAQK